MEISSTLDHLIKLIAKLPSLGPRSSQRIVLSLLHNKNLLVDIARTLEKVEQEIKFCEECGNVDITSPCKVCMSNLRDKTIICIVENIQNLWAIERGKCFNGLYHVIGGTISAIHGRMPQNLNISSLKQRVENNKEIAEIIIATSSNLDGQTTAHYIADMLEPYKLKISHLAHGIPIGAELEYMDEGTISVALKLRQKF